MNMKIKNLAPTLVENFTHLEVNKSIYEEYQEKILKFKKIWEYFKNIFSIICMIALFFS